jgi:hypothetical protein
VKAENRCRQELSHAVKIKKKEFVCMLVCECV